jgi:uncharacterized delta-60 repeat protein
LQVYVPKILENFAPQISEKDSEMNTNTKFTQLAFSVLLVLFPLALASAADCYLFAPGCLDASFGGGTGKVLTNTDGNISAAFDLDQARALAVQANGKILAAGITTDPNTMRTQHFAVLRFNADGSLDPAFGSGGLVTTSFSTGGDRAYAVAIQSDGQIVVAGTTVTPAGNVLAVARYNGADGTLDGSFGSGGKVTVSFANHNQNPDTEARSVAIQTDGKIVVGGFANNAGVIARLNSNGSLDTSFASGGKLTSSINTSPSGGLVIQTDGRIALGGWINGGKKTGYDFAVARYNANGSVDTTFGNGGVATADFSGLEDRIRAVTIDGNNNIVAAGVTTTGSGTASKNFAVARFTPSGQLDSTFGSGGKVTTDIFGNWDDCYGVAMQSNGQIVAAGFGYDTAGTNAYFTLVRYNANGTLDPTFGTGGIVTTNMGGGPDNFAYSVVIQADGKILAGGTADTANTSDGFYFALARYFQ